MPTSLTRNILDGFYQAYAARDSARLSVFLDDDVEWLLTGPVDVLWYCGRLKGKAAVMELITSIGPKILELKRFDFDDILISGDQAATFAWFVGQEHNSGREVKFRCAHFLRFRDGKVISFRTVSDTYHVVEQMVGHPLDLGGMNGHAPDATNGHNGAGTA